MAASAAGWVILTLNTLPTPLPPYSPTPLLPTPLHLTALAFLLALSFYIRDRLDRAEQETDQITMPDRTAWIRRYAKVLRGVVWAGFIGALILVAMQPISAIPLLAGLGFALTYTVRWLPWQGRRVGWKHLPAMKMPFVAVLWTITTVITPATVYGQLWQAKTWWLAAAVCTLIMVQILLNDLRDIEADRISGTQSLPVLVGDRPSRWIGGALALASIWLSWPFGALPFTVTAVYSLVLLWQYQRDHDARWRVWIEGQGVVAAVVSML